MAAKGLLIEKEISELVHLLSLKKKKAVLSFVKELANADKDWWDDLPDEVKAGIDEAIAELNAGKGIPHEEVMKSLSKWL